LPSLRKIFRIVSAKEGENLSAYQTVLTQNYSGNFTKVTQRLPVKIKFDKGDRVFKPGMSAKVKIHTA